MSSAIVDYLEWVPNLTYFLALSITSNADLLGVPTATTVFPKVLFKLIFFNLIFLFVGYNSNCLELGSFMLTNGVIALLSSNSIVVPESL